MSAGSSPSDLAIADPLDLLSFVAAATERILLGAAVLLLPYHQPVVLAKRLATIDQLSRGRMRLLTVGVGALPGEAAAVGVDYTSRGRRADEALDVLRLLWAGDASGVCFDGEFFSFSGVCSFPKPYGATSLPIHVGGSSLAAARRAGSRGDGYFPGGMLTPAQRIEQIELARQAYADRGRAVSRSSGPSAVVHPDDPSTVSLTKLIPPNSYAGTGRPARPRSRCATAPR